MDLPIFQMVIDESLTSDVEVSFIALVDKPAIEKNFLAFNDQRLNFAVDAEKRIISGPAMVADQLIYRKDETGEYNVFFSSQTIMQIAEKFFKKDYHKNLNLFHDPSLSLDGVTIFESFVSDKARGIQPMKGFEDLPDGSWFISAKIDNEDVWQNIKSGAVKGFSVEGIFSFMKISGTHSSHSPLGEEKGIMSDVKNELKDLFKKISDSFLGELPKNVAPPAPEQLAAEVTLKDGTVCTVDRMEPGGLMMKDNVPMAPGEYEVADGSKVTVGEGGVISAIAPAEMVAPDMNTDYSKQFEEVNGKFADYEAKFTAHTQALEAMKAEFTKSQDQIRQLVELVGKMIETPTAETVTGNSSQFNTQKQTKEQRIKDLAETLSNLKKK